MNGKNFDLLKNKRRESAAAGASQSYDGPGDVEAAAREYNTAVVFTDLTAIDASTAVDRIIEDSWNGEAWSQLFSDTGLALGVTRKEVLTFAGFLRVRHVVRATAGGNAVGASFGAGITYKQS